MLIKLILEEAGAGAKKKAINNKTKAEDDAMGSKWYIAVAVVFLLIVLFQMSGKGFSLFQSAASEPIADASLAKAVQAIDQGGYQEVNINIGQYGYDPEVIKVKAGTPVKLNFEKDYSGCCLSVLRIPGFNIQKSMQVGKTTVEITPTKPGQYSFACGMGMFGGTIIVES